MNDSQTQPDPHALEVAKAFWHEYMQTGDMFSLYDARRWMALALRRKVHPPSEQEKRYAKLALRKWRDAGCPVHGLPTVQTGEQREDPSELPSQWEKVIFAQSPEERLDARRWRDCLLGTGLAPDTGRLAPADRDRGTRSQAPGRGDTDRQARDRQGPRGGVDE